jgi:hypothetical protein
LAKPEKAPGNYIGEWFGYRTYPSVRLTPEALEVQNEERCPFLSKSIGEKRDCIKAQNSRGVCTINTLQAKERADWLVCPYRALDDSLVGEAIETLFGCPRKEMLYEPGPALALEKNRIAINDALSAGRRCFIYFNDKLGGELSITGTSKSPEFSFDMTLIEIVPVDGLPSVGRFGIMEIQTMDFHGSYKAAVTNLKSGLHLHREGFPDALRANPRWLSEDIEGPNISNVFKRTFYQLAFKFEAGETQQSAGCVLAIPKSVWNSWQPHLAAPELVAIDSTRSALLRPGSAMPKRFPGWIFVFEIEDVKEQPAPIKIVQRIGTNVPALVYYALDAAPKNAITHMQSELGLYSFLRKRLGKLWPELAATIAVVKPPPKKPAQTPAAKKPRQNKRSG